MNHNEEVCNDARASTLLTATTGTDDYDTVVLELIRLVVSVYAVLCFEYSVP